MTDVPPFNQGAFALQRPALFAPRVDR